MSLRATILDCTLKPSPEPSNTEGLARVVIDALESAGVRSELTRVIDLEIKPGVESDMGAGDEWPAVLEKVIDSEILVVATPTWLGRPSSVAQRVLERLDALLSETTTTAGRSPTTESPGSSSPATRTARIT